MKTVMKSFGFIEWLCAFACACVCSFSDPYSNIVHRISPWPNEKLSVAWCLNESQELTDSQLPVTTETDVCSFPINVSMSTSLISPLTTLPIATSYMCWLLKCKLPRAKRTHAHTHAHSIHLDMQTHDHSWIPTESSISIQFNFQKWGKFPVNSILPKFIKVVNVRPYITKSHKFFSIHSN